MPLILPDLATHQYIYRPLKRGIIGWDVIALQTALVGLGYALPKYGVDGDFGFETAHAVRAFQSDFGLDADGVAGILSQRESSLRLGKILGWALPGRILNGFFEFEGGYQLGNHTPPYSNGTRDLGIVQVNGPSRAYADLRIAFDTPARIGQLCAQLRRNYGRYLGQPGATSEKRAWELAAGSWNRPAHTDYLANPGKWPLPGRVSLTQRQRDWIEGYIDRVTTYVTSYDVP